MKYIERISPRKRECRKLSIGVKEVVRLCCGSAVFLLILSGCSAGSKEEQSSTSSTSDTGPEESINSRDTAYSTDDSDGDGVNDRDEAKFGRNSLVADLPLLHAKFIQNFKISGNFKDREGKGFPIEINTEIGDDDPDFKYRVGKIFARDNSYKVAASFGRFSSHSVGEISDHDLSWIKFPEIDSKFHHKMLLKYKKFFNEGKYPESKFSISLENVVKLKGNGLYREISNLEVSFYYYSYKDQNYVLLGKKIIDRHFSEGVTETFFVELEDIPRELVADNFFKRGEFIISEISDYEIPSMKTTYKKLLYQVKNQSIPVVINTPLDTKVYYVGINGKTSKLSGILTGLFKNQYTIQNNELIKLGQFGNSLKDFTYLKELRGLDKEGKWVVITSPLTKNLLDYDFIPKDRIVLSYILGSELSRQKDEVIFSYRDAISGGNGVNSYALGNVMPNSKVDIQISPKRKFGKSVTAKIEVLDDHVRRCGRNCRRGREIYCKWKINLFKDYDTNLSFNKKLTGDISKISLLINNQKFSIKSLLKEKKIDLYWAKTSTGVDNLHISISDISKIAKVVNYEENLISLRVESTAINTHWGVKLTDIARNGYGREGCGFFTAGVALKYKAPYISRESKGWSDIQQFFDVIANPEIKRKVKFKTAAPYYQRIEVGVSSTIVNYFN